LSCDTNNSGVTSQVWRLAAGSDLDSAPSVRGVATGYHGLGVLAQDRGDSAEAERRYRQSLDINERLGNQAGAASSYHQLGMLTQARGDYAEAERSYLAAADIFERLADRYRLAIVYGQLGTLARNRGDPEEARRQYAQSLRLRTEVGECPFSLDAPRNV
jgi:tetratricopeptide (TPR) repeat protein